jgi:papilin
VQACKQEAGVRGIGTDPELSWTYNQMKQTCVKFVYSGVGGNDNNFQTEKECEEKCEPKLLPCEQKPGVRGLCKAYMPMYTYDPAQGGCVKFIYGGCGGNSNRFPDLQTCIDKCEQVVKPHIDEPVVVKPTKEEPQPSKPQEK